jgi:hypothetical protein
VAGVVLLVFEFFPTLADHNSGSSSAGITGFGMAGELHPGVIDSLSESDQRAFSVSFPSASKIPKSENLYWRAQVLTRNEGLSWRQERLSFLPKAELASTAPQEFSSSLIMQEIRLPARYSGYGISLDSPVRVEALKEGRREAFQELWGHVFLGKPVTRGTQILQVLSSENSLPEVSPSESVFKGLLSFEDKRLKEIFVEPLREDNAVERLNAFFGSGRFEYSLSPGTMNSGDVFGFLTKRRKGFCEHYAASAANLFRANGIPARVVLGYLGGEWSGWDRSLLVRERDAHAWTEFWSRSQKRWIRYDAVAVLAPERMSGVRDTFLRNSFGSRLVSIPRVLLSWFEDATTSWEDALRAFEDSLSELDFGRAGIGVLLVGGLGLLLTRVREFRARAQNPNLYLERVLNEFRLELVRKGVLVVDHHSVRMMAQLAHEKSSRLGAVAETFVRCFEAARYSNRACNRALMKELKLCLRELRRPLNA